MVNEQMNSHRFFLLVCHNILMNKNAVSLKITAGVLMLFCRNSLKYNAISSNLYTDQRCHLCMGCSVDV